MNLSYRLRPTNLDEFIGQEHLVGKGKIIPKMIESGHLFSIIFWGPPGTGKTTLAKIIARAVNADFHELSGVESGKKDLHRIVDIAKQNVLLKQKTVLFIDEIHRWSKAQQDALLPHVESNLLILIGATTENPSFEVIGPLLSRCKIFVLQPLSMEELDRIVDTALKDKARGLGNYGKKLDKEARELLLRLSGGDARILLNALEIAATNYGEKTINAKVVEDVFQTKTAGLYDKKADEHYNTISAFIKSLRGSDADAAVYYLVRMLENGEDPRFVARRMIIFASEDIGLADRGALIQANAAYEAVHKIGPPEAKLILTHITIYLAKAKKSRLVPNSLMRAQEVVFAYPNEPIPLHLRNAPTKLMKNLGYAKDYRWSEKYVGPTQGKAFLPEKLQNKRIVTEE